MTNEKITDKPVLYKWMQGNGSLLNLTKCLEMAGKLASADEEYVWWHVVRTTDCEGRLKADVRLHDISWSNEDTLMCLVKALHYLNLDYRGGPDPVRDFILCMENSKMMWHFDGVFDQQYNKDGGRKFRYNFNIGYDEKDIDIKDDDLFSMMQGAYILVKNWPVLK